MSPEPTERDRVYVDHNATSPLRPEVFACVCDALAHVHGNPSSPHAPGAAARRLVEGGRRQVAALLSARPSEIIFTSSGTEANNLAITGAVRARRLSADGSGLRAVLVGSADHHSAIRTAEALEAEGVEVVRLALDASGVITERALSDALDARHGNELLVSIAWVNNETGVVQDVPALARLAHADGACVHADAVQAAGRLPVDVGETGVDLCSISAHKLGGPKGVGALFARSGLALAPVLHGGGQERGHRSGTLNVPAIAGFGEACRVSRASLESHATALRALTAALEAGLRARFPSVTIHGSEATRVPGTSSIGFPGADAERLLIALDLAGVSASAGAACTTGTLERSHVLEAMGVSPALARGTVRVSFGWSSSASDVDRVLEALGAILPQVVTT